MPNHKVKLFYDIISPYSFIGFESLLRYRVLWPIDVVLRPVCLGALFRDVKNPPPVTLCEAKAKYLSKEVGRVARHYGVPLNMPPNFHDYVMNATTVSACRLIVATQHNLPEKAEEVSRHLFSRFWIDNKTVKTEDDLTIALKKARLEGKEIRELLGLIQAEGVKKTLRENTKEAEELGAFGMPWYEVTRYDNGKSETFFGTDRLPLIGEFIDQHYEGPLRHLSLF